MLYPVFTIQPSRNSFEAIPQCVPIALKVLGMDQLVPVRCLEFTAFQSENFSQTLRLPKGVRLDVPFVDPFGYGLRHESKARLAFAKPGTQLVNPLLRIGCAW